MKTVVDVVDIVDGSVGIDGSVVGGVGSGCGGGGIVVGGGSGQ